MNINYYEGKKVLIIVPHQDDEINIAGNFIASLKNTNNIFVLYTTNGDFIFDAKYRYKEAIKSLKILGNIPKENVFFLGYSDQSYDQKTHMYNIEEDWMANKGFKETYAPKGFKEWNYYKHGEHCTFNKNNFTKNIKEVIEDVLPDTIVCIDLDFHPDHIMTSLCFEKAMGEILNKKDNNYFPQILKTFAYENSYLGPVDFNKEEDVGMKFNIDDEGNLKSNPYYNIKDSIILDIDKRCYTKNLFKNIIYKSIKAHKSQVLVQHAESIINANSVYWGRNTKNILNKAEIMVSSGKKEYLNDFMLLDTDNVLNGNEKNIQFNKGIWIPDENDEKKEIYIKLLREQYIDSIILYKGRKNLNFVKNIELEYDNVSNKIVLGKNFVNIIKINRNCNFIKIKILDKKISNGFSEIEILEKNNNNNENTLNEKTFENTRLNKIMIKINKLIISKDVFLQKVYRKIFIR